MVYSALFTVGVAQAAMFTVPLHEIRARASDDGTRAASKAGIANYFTTDVTVGGQIMTVRIDTTSNALFVPGADAKGFNGTKEHSGAGMSSVTAIDCHSTDCVAIRGSSADHVPTICTKKTADGKWQCPTPSDGAPPGAGICEVHPGAVTGPVTACADHLNPPCPTVLGMGYKCDLDMKAFSPSLAGKHLSDFCPQSCKMCGGGGAGPTRFCSDNGAWKDSTGNACEAYAAGGPKASACFSSSAYIACPKSCGACGDCCDQGGGCFFRHNFNDGSTATGTTAKSQVGFAEASPMISAVDTVVKIVGFTDTLYEPNTGIDGVLGLGVGETCDPACQRNTIDKFLNMANPAQLAPGTGDAPMGAGGPAAHRRLQDDGNAVVGLCLGDDSHQEHKPSSMDIGGAHPDHYNGAVTTIPLNSVGVDNNYYAVDPMSSFKVGTAPLTGDQITKANVIFDLNTKFVLLPDLLFEAYKLKLGTVADTLFGDMQTSAVFGAGCAGPLHTDNDWEHNLPTLTLQWAGGQTLTLSPDVYMLPIVIGNLTHVCSRVQGYKGANILLGQAVLRSKYFVLDRNSGTPSVGWATKADCAAGTNGQQSACKVNEWKCKNNQCIPKANYKDGITDCFDNSDEPPKPPPPPPAKCPRGPTDDFVSGKKVAPYTTAHGRFKLSAGSDYGNLAVLHCDEGYKPSGDQTVYCNAKRGEGYEKPFSTCVPDAGGGGGGGGGSCTERKTNGMTCGNLLKQVGKCPKGSGCKQADCNWATRSYRFDCKCTCLTGSDPCTVLRTKVAAACKPIVGNVFGCADKEAKIKNCGDGKCKSSECGDGNTCRPQIGGSCAAYGSTFVGCKPCNVCTLPCVSLFVDHSQKMAQCKVSLPGKWRLYAGTLGMICM